MTRFSVSLYRIVFFTMFGAFAANAQDLSAVQRLYDAGRFVEALQLARQTAAAQPSSALAQYWSGMTALRCGALDEADRAFDRALRNRPNYADAAMGRGQVFESREQWPQATDWYEKAWKMDQSRVEPLLRIAHLHGQWRLGASIGVLPQGSSDRQE